MREGWQRLAPEGFLKGSSKSFSKQHETQGAMSVQPDPPEGNGGGARPNLGAVSSRLGTGDGKKKRPQKGRFLKR